MVHDRPCASDEEYEYHCIDQHMLQYDPNEFPYDAFSMEFVYQHGISIPPDAKDTVHITPIIIFNSALSHQLFARQHQGEKFLSLLKRAKRLYQLAHDAHDTEESVLFQFAVINNTAVIHKTLGDRATSKQCFDYLLSLLMMFVDRGCGMQLRRMHGFLANLETNTEAAPAA
ncbi:MAG: hypothetical protein SGBAC_010179 [Bacillariaceae sp.]